MDDDPKKYLRGMRANYQAVVSAAIKCFHQKIKRRGSFDPRRRFSVPLEGSSRHRAAASATNILHIIIEKELVGMGAQAQGVVFLPLVFDPHFQKVAREDVAFQKEIATFFPIVNG